MRYAVPLLMAAVTVTVAGCGGGNGKVEVPDLEGLGYATADSTLDDAGLEMDVEVQWSDDPGDHIMSQTPSALVDVPEGTTVAVVISLGPQPKPAHPRPPHTRRSAYDRAVAALDRKCAEGPDLINRYVATAAKLLNGSGIYESRTGIITHVNKSIPLAHIARCDQVFAAYVTLRQGG
jgi:hypothetical protein